MWSPHWAVRDEHGGQPNGPITDDSAGVALADADADAGGSVVPGRHHVGQGEQSGPHITGVRGTTERCTGRE
jgi:hypothetical protein